MKSFKLNISLKNFAKQQNFLENIEIKLFGEKKMEVSVNSSSFPPSQKIYFCTVCKELFGYICFEFHCDHLPFIHPLCNKLLADYEFKQYLGDYVFQVISLDDQLPYALKMITNINNKWEIEFLYRETQLYGILSHQHILKFKKSFHIREWNLFVIIMELADCSLQSEMKNISQSTAFSYFKQMMEALHYLHDEFKIAHGNLKPQNFLVKQGVIKLCDLGETHLLIKKKMMTLNTNRGAGFNICIAPEVLNGERYNEKIDIWAAGVIFYCMLNKGRDPFDNIFLVTEEEIINYIKSGNVKFNMFLIRDPIFLEILESFNLFQSFA